MTFGLNTSYQVGLSPTAKVDVNLTNDSSLLPGSTLIVNEGSNFTLAAGKTLTIKGITGTPAIVDFSNLGTTVPANTEAAPVQINGTIELTGTGQLLGLNPGLFPTSPTDIYKYAAFGADGKIVLNEGTSYVFAAVPSATLTEVLVIGTSVSAYTWGTNTGAQIIIDGTGITIRDTYTDNPPLTAEVTVSAPSAIILKEQTLYLDTNVELKIGDNQAILFMGDAAGGARLRGPGKVVAGKTEITGGTSGWQVIGTESISIRQIGAVTAGTASITNAGTGTTTSFKALGSSAVITQKAGTANNSLTITANTIVDLDGSANNPGGSIVLKADVDPDTDHGTLTFEASSTTAKIQLGGGTGGTALTTALTSDVAIGGKKITTTLVPGNFTVLNDKLTVIGGAVTTSPNNTIAPADASTTSVNNDVVIVSNAQFVP
jgi:hypothetical protein